MKVVVYQKAGRDYPEKYKGAQFNETQRKIIKRRLELKPEDEVEIVEED